MTDLTQLMERATSDLQPDVAGLVAGGMARGRRLRGRRRLSRGLAALTGVAAIGVTAVLVPSYVDGDPARSDGSPSVSSRTSRATKGPTELPSLAALADGRVAAMPASSRLVDSWGSAEEGFVAASWRVSPPDASGAGQVAVLVEYADTRFIDRASQLKEGSSSDGAAAKEAKVAADPCVGALGTCTRLSDGSWLNTYTAPEPLSGGGDSEIIGAHAELWTPGGLHASATAYNAMGEKDTATTRATPVLDEHQLGELLADADLG